MERARLLALGVLMVIVLGAQLTGTDLDPLVIGGVLALGLGLQDWPAIFGKSGER